MAVLVTDLNRQLAAIQVGKASSHFRRRERSCIASRRLPIKVKAIVIADKPALRVSAVKIEPGHADQCSDLPMVAKPAARERGSTGQRAC